MFLTSLGSTETAPAALACSWESEQLGNIGLPLPGLELKLVPNEGKLETRMRGPNITPGYWRAPALTAAAFDEEGFYKIGDALKFADAAEPAKGLLFDGRIAEDFKLADRHVGERRAVAHGLHHALRAARARRGVGRTRPRRTRRADHPRRGSLS